MINQIEAEKIVKKYLNFFETDYEVILLNEKTLKKKHLMIFFYDTKEFLIDGNSSKALAGNNPILINLMTEKMYYVNRRDMGKVFSEFEEGMEDLILIDKSFL